MSYFKIGDIDFSDICAGLKVIKNRNFNSQTNANGDTVIDYINKKIQLEVSIIAINDTKMTELLNAIDVFNVAISYRDPLTNELKVIDSIISTDEIEYYTIQINKVMYKAFILTFTEL